MVFCAKADKIIAMMPKLLIVDKNKKIYDVPYLNATGAKAGVFFQLQKEDLIKLPFGSELFLMPDRYPVGYDPSLKKFITLKQFLAVSAFISPGYTLTHNAAYVENVKAKLLPLFSYSPVAFYKSSFYVPAIRIDKQRRHDLRLLNLTKVKHNIKKFQNLFKGNRIYTQLIKCALEYHCPNGKNFFLQRSECPLPVSPVCNAHCEGCISSQPKNKCPATQPRIEFIPTPKEIAQIALFHIKNVKNPIVSFGQGCEGEPLMQFKTLSESIKIIRQKTKKGTINLNTNASKPEAIKELFKTGLDSMRASLNSTQKVHYNAYYKPAGYIFNDVIKSIRYARRLKGFVSLNYLIMPGFTDSKNEVGALIKFIKNTDINMIQWRNLNYDPAAYARLLKLKAGADDMVGIKQMMATIKKKFPKIRFGYFNPHTNF